MESETMLKDINVRFFVEGFDDLDKNEVTHQEFVDLYAVEPHALVDVELHSVYANGVRQLCITLNRSAA
jgi:hypothetical protein